MNWEISKVYPPDLLRIKSRMKRSTLSHIRHMPVSQWQKLLVWNILFFFFIQNLFIGMVSRSSWYRALLVLLPSERASFCKPCFSSCRLAEDSRAANTQNYCLCMAKDGGDSIASWAFYIHEIGIGALHQALLLMFPLLLFGRGMKNILCERHVLWGGRHRRKAGIFLTAVPWQTNEAHHK